MVTESVSSMRDAMLWRTSGGGAAPTRTAKSCGVGTPGWKLMSVACGAMVRMPLDGASGGMSMSTVYGPAFLFDGEMVVSKVATTGVGHAGPLVPVRTSKPSLVTP